MIGEPKLDTDNKKLVARYLLGELSEEDSARLEDSSFSDPDQLEELWSVENDLIDGYARDELPAAERESFERLFLAHPDRRQRVEFALALARLSSGRAIASSSDPAPTRKGSLASFFRLPRLALTFAAAACFIFLMIGTWWLFIGRSSRSREQLAQRQETGQFKGQPGSSPQTNVNTQRNEPAPTVGKGADNSEGGLRAGSKPSPAAPRQQPTPVTFVTFVLPPGLARSSSERTRLIVPRGRQLMRLQLKLEEHEAVNYEVFAADLNRAGVAVWDSEPLVILPPKRNRTLVLNIPVHLLATNTADYELTLKGRTVKGQAFETLSYYYLTIVKE